MKHIRWFAAALVGLARLPTSTILLTASSCVAQTAPAAYRVANQTRLAAVAPWLEEYEVDHPDKRQRVTDLLDS